MSIDTQFFYDNSSNIVLQFTREAYIKYLYTFSVIGDYTWKAIAPIQRKENTLTITDIIPLQVDEPVHADKYRSGNTTMVAVIHRVHDDFIHTEMQYVDRPQADIAIYILRDTTALYIVRDKPKGDGIDERCTYKFIVAVADDTITAELRDKVFKMVAYNRGHRTTIEEEQQHLRKPPPQPTLAEVSMEEYNKMSRQQQRRMLPLFFDNKVTD